MNKCLLAVAASVCLAACDAQDSDYYPYMLDALDAWVSDQDTDRSLFAGRTETGYLGRKDAAARCRDLAVEVARANQLKRWGYVCCTVTSSTDCATKVR